MAAIKLECLSWATWK